MLRAELGALGPRRGDVGAPDDAHRARPDRAWTFGAADTRADAVIRVPTGWSSADPAIQPSTTTSPQPIRPAAVLSAWGT